MRAPAAPTVMLALVLALGATARADGTDDLGVGVARFQAHDYKGARRALERAHAADPDDEDVALLLGICDYRLGKLDEAERPLRRAARSRDDETAASARIFLGLIARDRGDLDAARVQLDAAAHSRSPGLAESGRTLLEATSPHRLSLTFFVRPEYDSNVGLLPIAPTATSGAAEGDFDVLVLGAATLRPLPAVGLVFDEAVSYRAQATLRDFDMFASTTTARWAWTGVTDRVALDYVFEAATLGGPLFVLAHTADGAYRRALWDELGVGVRYTFRERDYYQSGYAPFSGPSHTGLVELSWGTPERPLSVALGYTVLREIAADPTFSAVGQGGRLAATLRHGPVDVALAGWAIARNFDQPDPTAGPRHDVQLFGEASLAVDLPAHLGLFVGASVLRNVSTVADYDYLKMTAYAGLVASWAGL